jgi:hypothetical protein
MAQQPPVGQGLLTNQASQSHSDTPNSVELLWTSDQADEEISASHQTTFTRDRHTCLRRYRTRNPDHRPTLDPRLRQRGATIGIGI